MTQILTRDVGTALTTLLAAIVLLLLLINFGRNRKLAQGLPLPPGPKGLPIIGNVLDMPDARLWEWAAEQSKKYGDLVYVCNFGQPMLFLNAYTDASELLDHRSSIYSSRAKLVFARQLQGWDWFPGFMPYGEEYRKHRALAHQLLQPSVLSDYIPTKLEEVRILLKGLLKTPDEYHHHIRRFPGAVILMIMYGHQVVSGRDYLVELSEIGVQTAADAETVYMVEFFSWLKYVPEWFPGAGFQKRAREGYAIARASVDQPYEEAKQRFMEGRGHPCAVSNLIQNNTDKDGNIVDEDVIKGSAGLLYIAAQDTITTTIMTAVLAMVLYPDVQKKAQEEIDRILGKDTLPATNDRESLPYVHAVIMEVLRWNVVTPFVIPHASTEDDEYKGYRIPAGTIVFPNVWAMSKNADMYSNPDSFDPERWLHPKDSQVRSEEYIFGFGRRICAGNHYALNAVFLSLTSMLAFFNVEKKSDPNGVPIEPKVEYTDGFTRSLKPFECVWTSRSSEAAEFVSQL